VDGLPEIADMQVASRRWRETSEHSHGSAYS
jgi:hypothetical protein